MHGLWVVERRQADESVEVLISNEERQRITDLFDIYDLLEELDISIDEFIDAFDFKIIESVSIMEKIGEYAGGQAEED